MRCPECHGHDSRVVDSRLTPDRTAIRRRRECETCTHRFTTYERVERPPVLVVKRDGHRQRFDRDKMVDGLVKALHRRPVALETIETFVVELEHTLIDRPGREVSSRELGEQVLGFLRRVDEVAYIRYASVYHQFADIDALLAAVTALRDRRS